MDVKDSISVTLKTIDGKETKDQSAKNIFSYKPIMSNILKYTVEEYRDCVCWNSGWMNVRYSR